MDEAPRTNRFFFANSWLGFPGFSEMVWSKWGAWDLAPGRYFDAIDFWQSQIGYLRRHLKGWGGKLAQRLEAGKIPNPATDLRVGCRCGWVWT
jgi:hypothetical protein